MSRHGEIKLPWGDGEYTFRLGYGELRQLQETCNAGPVRIAARLTKYHAELNPHGDNWRVEDIREPLRLGLMGAGMTQQQALQKVMKFCEQRPWSENKIHAWLIIRAALEGAPEEPILGKELEGEEDGANPPSTMTKSLSDNSTNSVQ